MARNKFFPPNALAVEITIVFLPPNLETSYPYVKINRKFTILYTKCVGIWF